MDIASLENFLVEQVPSFLGSSFYDLGKFVVGYLIARLFYERAFKGWLYGRWSLIVTRHGKELTHRNLSPEKAEKIIKNDDDLSVYVKGVVSTYAWLNMDICSNRARREGLLSLDKKARTITVDLDKNPKSEQSNPALADAATAVRPRKPTPNAAQDRPRFCDNDAEENCPNPNADNIKL